MSVHEVEAVVDSEWDVLQSKISGEVVLPDSPGYFVARRLFNPAFDPQPAAVIRCKTESDVREAIRFVTEQNRRFTVRSGGHTTAGYSSVDGQVVIDVRNLDDVVVEPLRRIATVGTGATFAKLNRTLGQYGLHVPGGECDSVCVGGFVQGGGYGFTSRTFGMNCDNVISMRVMLADGSCVTAGSHDNADLLWAMCGGTGGNFGVLLSVTYRLFELHELCGWSVVWPLETPDDRANAALALKVLQAQYMKSGAAKELNSQVMVVHQSADENFANLTPWMIVRGTYVGPLAHVDPLIEPLVRSAGAVRQYVTQGSYAAINALLLNKVPQFPPIIGKPKQRKRARYVELDLEPSEWRALLDFYVGCPNRLSYLCIETYGGAINAARPDLNAFVHRSVAFSMSMGVFWTESHERESVLRFLNDWCHVVAPYWNGHVYQNYPSPDLERFEWAYWGTAFNKLRTVKAKYDPHNRFVFPQSLRPAAPSPEATA